MNIARMLARATRPMRDRHAARHPHGAVVVEVDVRDELRSGKEPFSRIMAAVEALRPAEVLRVRAIFEPVPLLHALGRRGFSYECEAHGADDWSVWFWRPENAVAAATHGAVAHADEPGAETLWLDVRGLQPPEPLMRTLAALDALPAGKTLVQIHSRVPQLLFPVLADRGFACDVDERDPERVLVRIWRAQ